MPFFRGEEGKSKLTRLDYVKTAEVTDSHPCPHGRLKCASAAATTENGSLSHVGKDIFTKTLHIPTLSKHASQSRDNKSGTFHWENDQTLEFVDAASHHRKHSRLPNVKVTAATANVCTLHPHQEERAYAKVSGVCLLGKVQILEEQFALDELDVVGVQEGRSKLTEVKQGHTYQMAAAAAYGDGSAGVQLWVRHGISIINWREFNPRLMFGIVRKRSVDMGYIVAHAPHMHASDSDKNVRWEQLHNTTKRECS